MASQAMLEPMNATTHHAKVKVSLSLAGGVVVAGTHVEGTMEMECRAEAGLGIGTMMVELFAVQELTSRDHSATSTFLHTRRLFQAPGLPPSNAVHAHPLPGDPPLPQHYHPARRGISRFPFRVPVPRSAPASISFGGGLAGVRYELRASAEVYWKKERRVVLERKPVEVEQAFDVGEEGGGGEEAEAEATVVGENGKLWMQGRVVGGIIVGGESACVELQVKNHSAKKNTSLTLSLTRSLILQTSSGLSSSPSVQPLLVTDTLLTVPFRGPEYTVPPGAEGVARLVFDVPVGKGGVRGGIYCAEGDGEGEGRGKGKGKEALFEVRCEVVVKVGMGVTSKDITLSIPITILHPAALPLLPAPAPPPHHHQPYLPHAHTGHAYPYAASPLGELYGLSQQGDLYVPQGEQYAVQGDMYAAQGDLYALDPYGYQFSAPVGMMSPPPQGLISPPLPLPNMPYLDPTHNQIWLPPPPAMSPLQREGSPNPNAYYYPHGYSPHPHLQQQLLSPVQQYLPPRPSSAGAGAVPLPLLPLPDTSPHHNHSQYPEGTEPEEGKAPQAQRIAQHLRMSSRNRSVSPLSHRFPVGGGMGLGLAGHEHIPGARRTLPVPPFAEVHSPRPQLSPTGSYTGDGHVGNGFPFPATVIGNNSRGHGQVVIPKSTRVAELEKMADGVLSRGVDLSGDLLAEEPRTGEQELSPSADADLDVDVNKTLPSPPVPTSSGKPFLPFAARTRVDTYFSPPPDPNLDPDALVPDPIPSDKTPPTPTLLPRGRVELLGVPGLNGAGKKNGDHKDTEEQKESGLDALERRLLAEVGTRKHIALEEYGTGDIGHGKHSDVRELLLGMPSAPIAIPPKSPEPLNDSAISSLSLAAECEPGRDRDLGMGLGLGVGERYEQDLGAGYHPPQHESLFAEAAGSGRSYEYEFLRDPNGGGAADGEDHDSDVKTHRAGKSSLASDRSGGRSLHERERERGRERGRERRREGKKKEKEKERGEKERGEKEKKEKEEKDKGEKKDKRDGEKMRKSAKGRVAAWLGGIDPNAPPPEDVIPASPSVPRGPGDVWDKLSSGMPLADARVDDEDVGALMQKKNEKEKSASVEPAVVNAGPTADIATGEVQDVSSAPNPRSSGFVPIGTLKRDTFQRRALANDSSVIQEARRVADLWSSPVPKEKEKEKPAPRYSLAAASPPTMQSIRTNRRVSPPSASSAKPAVATRTPIGGMTRDIWKRADPEGKRPVALPRNRNVPQQRLPAFPPPPSSSSSRQDSEVKYDVRSARGGRGGKVTAVASLWASAGTGSTETKRIANVDARKRMSDVSLPKPPVGRVPGKLPLSAVAMTSIPASTTTTASASNSMPKERAGRPPPPSIPPKPLGMLSSTRVIASAPATNTDNSTTSVVDEAQNQNNVANRPPPPTNITLPAKLPRLPAKSPALSALSTPTTAGTRTPTAGEPKFLDLAGKRSKPVIKSSSVPAIISSSHATPTLSSTASLARPHSSANVLRSEQLPNKLPKVASAPHLDSAKLSLPRPVSSPQAAAPKGELAFGQARLRDLIKKYQGQGT